MTRQSDVEEPAYEPDPAAIAADLADDGVHVDPALTDAIAAGQLDDITSLVADAEHQVFVLAVPLGYDSDVSANQLVTLVHRELPEDGVYFVTAGTPQTSWRTESTTYGVSTDNENSLAALVARDRYPSDLGEQLVETLEIYTSGDARQVHEEHFPEQPQNEPDEPGQFLGMDTPVAVGLGAVLVAVVVGGWWLGRRRPRADVALKRRALQRISSAQMREWRRRAETESAALGQRIRELEIGQGADSHAWAAALDHYQAATAVLDGSTDAADSIGALVLTQRGDDALDHAVAGKPWTPKAACFFNPLHGTATTTAPWSTPAGARDVPCCAACRRDIRKHREPDILDLPTETTVVHYMDADAEPWASTGYGSLTPDLLTQLQQRGIES
ncbi:hypothetical protein [Haloactinopolyspora sp.]|uniref:hypothetical protein n=1 Tax=Haloactinopolyspora sp. TaxID=1966353 RepID=UPI0026288E7E|nr:hypothetical protein [Haloactinopolyspora sp.]